MVRQVLPCAEKTCKSKMKLTENNDAFLYYNCLKNHNKHIYRYNISKKKWEKIVIKGKLLLNYNEDPYKETIINTSKNFYGIKKTVTNQNQDTKILSNLTTIKGIGSKRAKELEIAGIKNIYDLAKCSPKHLSEITGIPISQISNWIIEANSLTEKAIILTA